MLPPPCRSAAGAPHGPGDQCPLHADALCCRRGGSLVTLWGGWGVGFAPGPFEGELGWQLVWVCCYLGGRHP